MPNQNKPTHMNFSMKIVKNLQNHFNTSHYGLGYTKFREIHNDMGLLHTCQQSHTIESIREAMIELHKAYPNARAQEMVILLFHEKEMSISRNLVISYCAAYEADLIHQRKARRLKRRRFWAAGVNDLFALSCLGTTDIPMVTQSDSDTENHGIANAHTMLHQMYDLALQGTLQYYWMRTKKNVKPEIAWSQLRCWFTPGFETLLDITDQLVILGRPSITRQSVWTIYLDLLHSIQRFEQLPAAISSLTDTTDLDEGALPLLNNQRDLFFHEDIDGTYYMGGVHGGQGLDMSDHRRLDELAKLDEPGAHLLPTAPIIEEEGLVIAEFSDEEDNEDTYDW
ncbi:uncharacterized protein EDB93DRAFT_1100864 [Suillus bovinus]|uniref:uncharacterized protein n=1 Tax=Suillus bovinus TaxID=48563 RepID=UPI001B862CDC|nr:uncharacterized protein EDB93DRAFT_1100864 [Suillus bovinus]KAG2158087.1 hypothetical protein EDB93DRAFT_1100864 [Suillus bovinus]